MSQVKKCDRCKQIEGDSRGGGTIAAGGPRVRPRWLRHWLGFLGWGGEMDLCDSCVDSLRRWMKGDDTVSTADIVDKHFGAILRVLDERLPKKRARAKR